MRHLICVRFHEGWAQVRKFTLHPLVVRVKSKSTSTKHFFATAPNWATRKQPVAKEGKVARGEFAQSC